MVKENTCEYVVTINDAEKIGLHARPVAKIVGAATKFKETTTLTVYSLDDSVDVNKPLKLTGNEKKANGFSILSVIGLGAKNNTKIAFVATGEKCQETIAAIKQVLKDEKLV